MNVAVFGGSQPREKDAAYAEAMKLGRLLAERGHTVLTGGYIGTMEAVSRGACEAGGHVVGITCEEIESWRPVKANRWVLEERRKRQLMERLQELVTGCDAAIALPGGPGTLTEIALSWNLMIVAVLPPRPLILVGEGWLSVFDQVFTRLGDYTPESQRGFLQFAADVPTAVGLLESAHAKHNPIDHHD
jgi:uncharacterized protein (TIGR00730 family)